MSIIDLHCDTVGMIHFNKKRGQKIVHLADADMQINTKKLVAGGCYAQCFAMFVPYAMGEPFKNCMEMIDTFEEELALNPELKQVKSYKEALEVNKEGKIGAILTVEDGGVVEASLEKLHAIYDRGVRMITLTWNYENLISYPNYGKYNEDGKPDYRTPNTTQGLTEFGFEMVKEMNKLGIIVDCSHVSDACFYDVIKTSTKPIVCSHSNARAVCGHVRNMTDDMLLKLKENGGVTGMNYCADFMDDNTETGKKTFECTLRHMDYIKNLLGGVDNIALGSDFDGISPDIELKDYAMYPEFINAMKEHGYTQEEIEKITYKNFLRVFEANKPE